MVATGYDLEDAVTTYHPAGVAAKAAGKFIQYSVSLPTALEEMWCGTSPARPQQCVHDGRRCGHTFPCIPILGRTRLCFEKPEEHDHTVWAVEALECPNTQVQAGCLRSATGHLFEHVMATYHPLGIAGDASGQ